MKLIYLLFRALGLAMSPRLPDQDHTSLATKALGRFASFVYLNVRQIPLCLHQPPIKLPTSPLM